MRRFLTLLLLGVAGSLFAEGSLKLKTGVEMGNSNTVPFSAGWMIEPRWEINKNIDLLGGLKIANEQRSSLYLANTIKFTLGKVELQLQDKFLYNSFGTWNIEEYNAFAGLKVITPHFDGLLGVSSRLIKTISPASYENITEPFNWQYELGLRLFKTPAPWNVRLGIANFDSFSYERMESIIFCLRGEYVFSNKLSGFLNGTLTPAGNFHSSAAYYGYYIQTGIQWTIW